MQQRASAAVACWLLAVAAAVLLLAQQSQGHVVMIAPKSRPWYDYLLHYNYNPHAVYAGGVPKVSKGETLQWPNREVNSICGDAKGENKWDNSSFWPLEWTYSDGQVITTDIVMAQNHLGRIHLNLCPLDAKQDKDCISLTRPDGKGTFYDLRWTKDWAGVSDGFTPPVSFENLEYEIYKQPPVGKPEGCATWSCDMFKGMFVYKFKWQLPKGYTCSHCKLQLYYLTASRCWPPCVKQPCEKPVNYPYCGEKGASYPEEFWNCADITIKAQK